MNVNHIGGKMRAGAFEGEADDIDAPGYAPVDLDIGLQAKEPRPFEGRGQLLS
jgi:hypothetical protein